MNSERIFLHHLRRKAVIYIRQSTGHQVLTNHESQLMQRAMKEHALRLGWTEESVEIVEADTGQSRRVAPAAPATRIFRRSWRWARSASS